MKRYVMMVALLLVTVMASAIPAKRGQWSMITLADGTQVKAELCGDEHLHFMQDSAGNKYVADESGTYQIADMEALVANANTRRAKAVSRRKAKMRKANNNGGDQYRQYVYIRDSRFTTAADFAAAQANVQILFELNGPITITLDPASLSTLRGDNTVWSDGDSVEMTYKAASS